MGRLQSIQILRFIAAAMVILKHADDFNLGGAGVDIFFVISGFIIARISAGKTASGFMIGRARRIYPIYLICSAPYALIAISQHGIAADKLFVSLTLAPAFGESVGPYLRQGWTLSFEILFYCGAALALWRPALMRPMILVYAAALPLSLTGLSLFRFFGSPLILEFGMGVLIASAPKVSARAGLSFVAMATIALLATIPLSSAISEPTSSSTLLMIRAAVWGVPAAMLVYGSLQLEESAQSRIAGTLAALGDASYSIYLVHMIVLIALYSLAPWPLASLAAVVIGVGVHRYVETPLLAALRRHRKLSLATQSV